MITEISWDEFRASGMLWLINRTLHLFGLAICVDMGCEGVVRAYPVKCKFRGFSREDDDDGFKNVYKYLGDSLAEISKEPGDGTT